MFIKWLQQFQYKHFEAFVYRRRLGKRLRALKLSDRTEAPIATMDCRFGPACAASHCDRFNLNDGNFFGESHHPKRFRISRPAYQITLMAINLASYGSYPAYLKDLRKKSSNFYRDSAKALRNGYAVERFQFSTRTTDIIDIRQSIKVRSGGPVRDALSYTVDAIESQPGALDPVDQTPVCASHWDMYLGVFMPATEIGAQEKKLVAYARIRRVGNVVNYQDFIGHGEHMRSGIMMLLHLQTMQWLMNPENEPAKGVQYLTYGSVERGYDGIFFWKKKALFMPHVVQRLENPIPPDFDPALYLQLNPDVASTDVDATWHYQRHGLLEKRPYKVDLPADFDPATYLRLNPDVARDWKDGALHYTLHGWRESRRYKDDASDAALSNPS